jgi:hypothetical protein
MNKVIFQFGMLGFFVSLVVFGVGPASILTAVVQAFMVSIGIMVIGLVVLALMQVFTPAAQPQGAYPGGDGPGETAGQKAAEGRTNTYSGTTIDKKDTAASAADGEETV